MFCILKNKKYILTMFENKLESWKASYSFKDSNGQGEHYITVEKLSALLRGKTSKHHGGFYCLNCKRKQT